MSDAKPKLSEEAKLQLRREQAAHARASKAKRPRTIFSQLTPQQRGFVLHYIKNNFNGTQSALAAGYSSKRPDVAAVQLLANPRVKEAIEEQLGPLIASAKQVTSRLCEVGFNNALDFYGQDGQLDYAALKQKGYLVQEFDASDGLHKAKVKFQPQMPALLAIGKIHGLFVDRQEVSGIGGGPVQHEVLTLTPEQESKFAPKVNSEVAK